MAPRGRSILSTALVVTIGSYAVLSRDFGTSFVGARPKLHAPRVALYVNNPDGLLSPLVNTVKVIVGKDKLKEIRSKVIKAHGEVMAAFIDTADSESGEFALRKLFEAADKDNSGEIDREEFKVALKELGFSWNEDKQVESIFKKGDKDKNDLIDWEEFKVIAPTVLRQNLMKLAKENGGELGFLS